MNTRSFLLLVLLALVALHTDTIAARKVHDEYYKMFDMTPRSFDKGQLAKAYKRLAKQYHPDKNRGDKEAEAKFVEITRAFEVLNDDGKRRVYDQFGPEGVDKQGGSGGHPFDFRHAEDIFNSYVCPSSLCFQVH